MAFPRIHPIPAGFGMAFLLEYPHGMLLIDSGSPGQEKRVFQKMLELGRSDLKLIWITHAHYDHYGSAAVLRQQTGASIGVHTADADALTAGQSPLGTQRGYGFIYPWIQPLVNRLWPLPATPADLILEDGDTLETFGFPASVLHTPGHTPGHTCLLLEDRIAFAADLIGSVPHPKPQSLLATDWNQLAGSLARLQAAQPEWIYTGHSRQAIAGSVLQQIKLKYSPER